MAVFEREIPTKVVIDDTEPLKISIINAQTVANHTEYVIRVQRGPLTDRRWFVSRRYNDFVKLHTQLAAAKLSLQLPPKKLLGNMDREFIAQRQQALQDYLEILLTSPLCCCAQVKHFLDPEHYSQQFDEQALQHVSMALRSDFRFEVVRPLEEVGWRLRKHYFSVRHVQEAEEPLVLSWAPHGPDQHLEHRQLTRIVTSLATLQHPHIEESLLMCMGEAGAVVVRRMAQEGSLRDMLYATKPCDPWMSKLANMEQARPFPVQEVARIGAQLLDTLCFLQDKGLHYGHLHPGNVIVGEAGEARLLDLENSVLGLPCIYRPLIAHLRKVHTAEAIEAYCLGHTLFEMALGRPLTQPTCDSQPPDCPPQLWSLLEKLLTTDACRKGLPSLEQLRGDIFFSGIPRTPTAGAHLQLPAQLKQALATTRTKAEERLREDQKKVRQQKRQARVQQHLILEEQQQQQLQRKRHHRTPKPAQSASSAPAMAHTAAVNGKSPERSDSPASTNTSGGTLTPPLSLPVEGVKEESNGARSGDQEGLSALLGSICSFDKGSLKTSVSSTR